MLNLFYHFSKQEKSVISEDNYIIFSFYFIRGPLSVISELDTTNGFIGDLFLWTIRVEGLDDQDIEFPGLTSANDTLSIKQKKIYL